MWPFSTTKKETPEYAIPGYNHWRKDGKHWYTQRATIRNPYGGTDEWVCEARERFTESDTEYCVDVVVTRNGVVMHRKEIISREFLNYTYVTRLAITDCEKSVNEKIRAVAESQYNGALIPLGGFK